MSDTGNPAVAAELAAIRTRAEVATPGPWLNEPDTMAGRVWVQRGPRHHNKDCEPLFAVRDTRTRPSDDDFAQRALDAAFIAEARTDVPRLLGIIGELTARAERAESALAAALAEVGRLEREMHREAVSDG